MPAFRHSGIVVEIGDEMVSLTADAAACHEWAHRPDHAWPCSTLADLPSGFSAGFDTNGLVELDVADTTYDPESGTYRLADGEEIEIDASELNAFCADAIGAELDPDHQCFFVVVGQFLSADEMPHRGHYSRIGGTYYCDTCNSPYCDRA